MGPYTLIISLWDPKTGFTGKIYPGFKDKAVAERLGEKLVKGYLKAYDKVSFQIEETALHKITHK